MPLPSPKTVLRAVRAAVGIPSLLAVAGMAFTGSCGSSAQPSRAEAPPWPERPNVLLVISDDQDWEHFGFEGHPAASTPTLDALAETGTLFPVMHVSPRCRPTLAMLLSGRYPHQNGIAWNRAPRDLDPKGSLPRRFRELGYATYCAGKYWEGDRTEMGFEDGVSPEEGFLRKGQGAVFEFLDRVAGKRPFFLWWAPDIPHMPHEPPPEFLARIDPKKIPVPVWFHGSVDLFRTFERDMIAMEAWFDTRLGELLVYLEELGVRDDTLVVFLVDNGYSNGLISKGSPFEKGVRSPLIVQWPGHVPVGRCDELVSAVDIYPTLLDYAGAPKPERPGAPGHSLRPLIDGTPGAKGRGMLFGGAWPRTGNSAGDPARDLFALYARGKRWKYVLYLLDVPAPVWEITRATPLGRHERTRGEEDLYDLEADPLELHSLAADPEQRERMDHLRERALAWWRRTGGGPLALPRAEKAREPNARRETQ